jgi:hypothetical protein
MIICGIKLRAASGRRSPHFWEAVFYTPPACDLRLKLFTKSVDNAVENDLKNVPHRSLHYSQVILVKKPSKKNFPFAYQVAAPSYDDGAGGTADNTSRARR